MTVSSKPPTNSLPGFLCSKAIDIREVKEGSFVFVDAVGGELEGFNATDHIMLVEAAKRLLDIVPLAHADGSLLLENGHSRDGVTIPWSLEEPLVARIPDFYRIWLCGLGDHRVFDSARSHIPLAYLEWGFGTGDRDEFQKLHATTLKMAANGDAPFSEEMLYALLHHVLLKRICDDVLALIDRASRAYQRFLFLLRQSVRANVGDFQHLGATEIQHSGPWSIELATLVTVAVISAVSSMDVITRLIIFVNDTEFPIAKFKPQGTSYYSDLQKLKPGALPASILDAIKAAWSRKSSLLSLIQYRHDLVHSTTALELERNLFIGKGTDELNAAPLFYAVLLSRDALPTGQPVRFLAREYFTSSGDTVDVVVAGWLKDVIEAQAATASQLQAFIDAARSTATHRLAGC